MAFSMFFFFFYVSVGSIKKLENNWINIIDELLNPVFVLGELDMSNHMILYDFTF